MESARNRIDGFCREAGKPRLLFEAPRLAVATLGVGGADYAVDPDGQRFLMIRAPQQPQTAPTQINVVFNWFEELKQRAPASGH